MSGGHLFTQKVSLLVSLSSYLSKVSPGPSSVQPASNQPPPEEVQLAMSPRSSSTGAVKAMASMASMVKGGPKSPDVLQISPMKCGMTGKHQSAIESNPTEESFSTAVLRTNNVPPNCFIATERGTVTGASFKSQYNAIISVTPGTKYKNHCDDCDGKKLSCQNCRGNVLDTEGSLISESETSQSLPTGVFTQKHFRTLLPPRPHETAEISPLGWGEKDHLASFSGSENRV